MKIVVATGLYPPDIGGPATYAKMLEEHLPQSGIEISVFAFGEVRYLPKLVRHIVYAYRLFKKTKEANLIYALDPISVGLPALLVSKLTGKPYLVRLGGDYAWEQGQIRFGLTGTLDEYTAKTKHRPLPVKVLALLQALVVKQAKFVILPSEYLKSVVLTWGVKEEKIKVIYSALFPLPVSDTREVIRETLSYEGLVLITAARLTPWKGIPCLINLVAKLKSEGKKVTLVVAGDGAARPSLEAMAKEHDVSASIRFVGRLSKEALGAAIKGSDIFVFNPSYEGLPHQLLEVMDLGVSVVASNIAGNREVLTDKVSGLLVEQDDLNGFIEAIKTVTTDEKLRESLVFRAQERTKDFEQSKVTDKLIKLLKSI
jgi:glycosyltransferase involved in cell wall biosynthesis